MRTIKNLLLKKFVKKLLSIALLLKKSMILVKEKKKNL